MKHAQNAGYSVVIFWDGLYPFRFDNKTQLQDKLLIPVLYAPFACYFINHSNIDISYDDLLAADRANVEIAIKLQEEDLKKMQQYLRRLYYWFLLGPLITLEWLRRQEKLCCMSGGQQAEGGRVPEETTVESGLNSAADYGETLRNYNQEAEHEQTRGETQPLLLVSNGHSRPRAIRRVLNYLTRKLFGKLQSWTKVLGQICTCGAFSHAPNKQSRVNSNTLAQPLPPPPPHTMLDISQELQHCMGWWGGGAETNFEKDNSAFSNSVLKTQIIHAMTQVSRGILSTIVAVCSGYVILIIVALPVGISVVDGRFLDSIKTKFSKKLFGVAVSHLRVIILLILLYFG